MNDTDPRQAAWQLVADGVAAGLSIPRDIAVGAGQHCLIVYLLDNDTEAVERWAAWLRLPAPEMTLSPIASASHPSHPSGWFRPYEARTYRHPSTGHHVAVKTYVSVPAPAEAEQAAAR